MHLNFVFLFILTLSFAMDAVANSNYRRVVNFEWEEIEGAKSYDVELKLKRKDNTLGDPQVYKLPKAEWSGPLIPGIYAMRLRARDYRGVPGDWSDTAEIQVLLENVKVKSPALQSKIQSNDATDEDVTFNWQPTPGATHYLVQITDEEEKEHFNDSVKGTEFKKTLPVAKNFVFKILAVNQDAIESDATTLVPFSLIGKKLKPPQIKKPDNKFVRNIEWEQPEYADSATVNLFRFNTDKKKWEKYQEFSNVQGNSIPFDQTWPGGRYQVSVRAKSANRLDSEPSRIGFEVIEGNRSPAAEYTATLRQSIERLNGWYGVASYLITQMQFSGQNPEQNSVSSYSALGGTGRLGLGWADPKSPWGFLSILDLSGFTFNGETKTFASLEGSAVYRHDLGDRGEVKGILGLFYKEVPETIGDPLLNSSVTENVAFIGPHVGAEYWYSMSPKLGLQINTHLYYSLAKVSTPNGEDIKPTLSTQLGLMGSYRFSERFTGLMGYAMRVDKVSYKSATGGSSLATSGDVNTSTITGHYLNFLAEYNF